MLKLFCPPCYAITAQTDVLIAAGEFTLTSGGGSANRVADTVFAKGIKAVGLSSSQLVNGETYTIFTVGSIAARSLC